MWCSSRHNRKIKPLSHRLFLFFFFFFFTTVAISQKYWKLTSAPKTWVTHKLVTRETHQTSIASCNLPTQKTTKNWNFSRGSVLKYSEVVCTPVTQNYLKSYKITWCFSSLQNSLSKGGSAVCTRVGWNGCMLDFSILPLCPLLGQPAQCSATNQPMDRANKAGQTYRLTHMTERSTAIHCIFLNIK